MAAKTRTWVAMTVVAAFVVLAGAWFGLISPTLGRAGDTRVSIADEEARTATLTTQLAALTKEYAQLDAHKATLAALQEQIPQQAAMSEYRRQLGAAADAAGVTIVSVTSGQAVLTTAVTTAASVPATDAVDPAAAATTTEDGTAAQPAPAAPAGPETRLVGIPVTVDVLGTYAATQAFLAAVQAGQPRLFVVGGVNAVSQLDTAASAGRPAVARGDVELTMDGFVMVLPSAPTTDAGTGTDAGTEAPALPASARNPFAPVG